MASNFEVRMRVLVVNFALDDDSPVLAHQSAFVRELAVRVEKVHVVTEWLGRFDRHPANVEMTAIPRRPFGVPRRFGSLWFALPRVVSAVRDFRPDVCFVHMAHKWCYRLGPELKRRGFPLMLWYSHKQVSLGLRIATAFADRVVTATPEGFRLVSEKVEPIGHGIDVGHFSLGAASRQQGEIISVGRISPIKRLHLILEAIALLVRANENVRLRLIGPELTAADKRYRGDLESLAERLGIRERVEFTGPRSKGDIANAYRAAALHINVSNTGGLDKSVIEALACGCPVLTSSAALFDTVRLYPEMAIVDPTPAELANRIDALLATDLAPESLRSLVVGHHDLGSHVAKIVVRLEALAFPQVRSTVVP